MLAYIYNKSQNFHSFSNGSPYQKCVHNIQYQCYQDQQLWSETFFNLKYTEQAVLIFR
jgi:hypothetical protein